MTGGAKKSCSNFSFYPVLSFFVASFLYRVLSFFVSSFFQFFYVLFILPLSLQFYSSFFLWLFEEKACENVIQFHIFQASSVSGLHICSIFQILNSYIPTYQLGKQSSCQTPLLNSKGTFVIIGSGIFLIMVTWVHLIKVS